MGVIETIRRSYSRLTPGDWLTMKAEILRALLLPAGEKTCGYAEMATGGTVVDRSGIADFMSLAPSIRFLWLGLAVFAMLAIRNQRTAGYRSASMFLGVGLLGIAMDVATAWDSSSSIPSPTNPSLPSLSGCCCSCSNWDHRDSAPWPP